MVQVHSSILRVLDTATITSTTVCASITTNDSIAAYTLRASVVEYYRVWFLAAGQLADTAVHALHNTVRAVTSYLRGTPLAVSLCANT
jgi:hypothetical protein